MRDGVTQFKKALVLRAACKLFSERGYSATTIDAITAELSSSRRAIYDHFAGKAEILAEICEQSVRLSVDLAERVAAEPGDPLTRLRRLACDFTAIVIDNRDHIAVGTHEMKFLPPEARRRILRLQEKFDRLLTAMIADGVRQGLFASPDPALSALTIAGMIIWVHRWYREGGRLAAGEIAAAMGEAALRLVLAENP
ncbi:MAG TPA: TetR family transcriptional regulator [Xanthobacteraceae bacterium]|nr:TetR family transcriptional regulator [Xanthobacteraceae bacterium]